MAMEGGRTEAKELEDGDEGRRLEGFLRWASSIGITDSPLHSSSSSTCCGCLGHSLHLAHFPDAGGRGLAARRELKREEIVLRVPRSALLTTENVLLRDPKLVGSFQKHRPQLSPTQLLTICLLSQVEKGKASWWYPYLIQLPPSYDPLPNFTQFEIKAFQVDDAIWVSEKAVSKARVEWKQSLVLMQEIQLKPQLQTFKSWLWASSTVSFILMVIFYPFKLIQSNSVNKVSTRALHVPWDCAGCLCPVGDLFNYAAPDEHPQEEEVAVDTESKSDAFSGRLTDGGYDQFMDSYCFYARKRYMKDEQVLLCYGTYTNLELLEHYGFLLTSNPNEKSFLPLDPSMQLSHSWPTDSLYIHQDGTPSFALMSSLRLWATPKSFRRAVGHLAYSGCQLSPDNEISVVKFLSKKCREMLDKLPTSHEDDCSVLDTIDQILQNDSGCRLGFEELRQFCEVNGLQMRVLESLKTRRRIERWKLGVQWRLNYKRDLLKCISFCKGVIDYNNLSC